MALTTGQKTALAAAHTPAARKKAVATLTKLANARQKLAEQYNVGAREFGAKFILGTIERLKIPLSAVPEILFRPFPRIKRAQLLQARANGHDKGAGVGIPLDAIPEKKERAAWGSKATGTKPKTHPNAALIEKTLDLLANPKTPDKVAARLTVVLDKLLG